VANAVFAKASIELLSGSRGFGGRFLAIALVEAIDASRRIDQLLFASEERVTSRADFDVKIALFRGAGLERLAASAGNIYFDVFWVNSWFHFSLLSIDGALAAFSNRIS
jgi:hypothetical protein